MNKKLIILLLVLLVITVAGCARGGYTSNPAYAPNPQQQPYIGGGCSVDIGDDVNKKVNEDVDYRL